MILSNSDLRDLASYALALLLACVIFVSSDPATAAELDKPFQSHLPDGKAYWVVTCMQADECFEDAFK